MSSPEAASNHRSSDSRQGAPIAADAAPLTARPLSEAACLRLLAEVSFGRIVYSRYALPAIRPVDHIIADGAIITTTDATTVPPYRQVVAYEADTLDRHTQCGWCVIITGTAEPVTDPTDLARYRAALRPRLAGGREHLLRIRPEVVTGIEYLGPARQ
ncbi:MULTISPECIES: pyridoxamine 5'-phosphate oxidase family protein [unclassified Nocardia]|uniref:pyridoxamine 5'-phosphate oxidase family protein n=1 Tax=unclassified Nocardia TaxID=2637762 RepID=UPI00278C5726|nr:MULTISPECIES: pyridoxamine 5'-phosphate oxidase family protein [unclassified Nocardia]